MPASASRSGPSAASRARAWSSVRAAGSRSAWRRAAAGSPGRRMAGAPAAAALAMGGGGGGQAGPFGYLVPVAVDLGEVLPAVLGAAGGVDGDVQVRAAGSVPGLRVPAAVGLLPRQAGRPGVLGGQPRRRVGQRGHV